MCRVIPLFQKSAYIILSNHLVGSTAWLIGFSSGSKTSSTDETAFIFYLFDTAYIFFLHLSAAYIYTLKFFFGTLQVLLAAMRALVPSVGIKSGPPALGENRLSHRASREALSAALGLGCCAWVFSGCPQQGHSLVAARCLLIVAAARVAEHEL